MKQKVEKRKPSGIADYAALALTTFGVGYIPGAPGTYGSAVAVAIYITFTALLHVTVYAPFHRVSENVPMILNAVVGLLLAAFSLLGIWASGRSIPLLGNDDPSEAVVDEVMGQLITFCFIPFATGWPFILAGFLLFRLFDIWKPFPVRTLEVLPGGLGICADDIVAGVYAGLCLGVAYGVYLWI